MKYKNYYESVQNCTPGSAESQQIVNGKYNINNNYASPEELNTDNNINEVSKSITSINGDIIKKIVSRKTCTCSSGQIPCPSHPGTERSSINGYTNGYLNMKSTTSKNNLNTSKKEEMPQLQSCKENGKILNKTKHEDVLIENREAEEEETTLSSSRTFTIKSSKSNVNNSDESKKEQTNVNFNSDDLRLSLTSLISQDETTVCEKQTSEAFQKWLTEKKRQEREIRQRELNLKQLIEEEKQRKLQMERENFINWLHAKKMKEKEEKASKKKALEEEQRRKNEKLKRAEINKKQYQLWLKLKEEEDLVKKINEQKRRIEKEERERQRLLMNKSAFQEWLLSAKDKPKPVPLNRGLESLRTSTSVSFVNPAPWIPNIVEKPKAKSK